MIREKYLPIGTVVLLKGGTKTVMITSYLIFSKDKEQEKKIHDYGGCIFPEGIVDTSHVLGFDHNQIEKIIYLGLVNEEQEKFGKLLIENDDVLRKKYEEEITNLQ